MDDLISRQAAIDAIKENMPDELAATASDLKIGYTCGMAQACVVLKGMPSAQPERKKGKWIEITDHEIPIICECSECEWPTVLHEIFNYCPNCGAEMRKET